MTAVANFGWVTAFELGTFLSVSLVSLSQFSQ